MKNVNTKRAITYFLCSFLALFLPIYAWKAELNNAAILVGLTFGAALVCLIYCMDIIHQKHEDDMLESLSSLIDDIINIENKHIFSEVEETLLSKIQYQVIKLSGIMTSQNAAIEREKNEIKSLISDISHQLKTPVSSLKMFGELLSEDDITEEQRKDYINVINQSLDKLTFLTDSMIKMSRLESGVIAIRKEECNTEDIILPAVKQALPKAKAKNIEIVYNTDQKNNLKLDTKWTGEALFNIIDNAIKYSYVNTQIIIRTENLPSFICIKITDQGMGISENEQSMIFKRFYRSERAGNEEGVGIGLFLAREIIVKQGGYIKVESQFHEDKNKMQTSGTTFAVYLPLV